MNAVHGHSRSVARAIALIAATCALLVGAGDARAAEQIGAGWTAAPILFEAGQPWSAWPETCSTWSNGADPMGNFWVPCDYTIFQLDPTGRVIQRIAVPDGYRAGMDVAVDPLRPELLYFTSGGATDDSTADPGNDGKVVRLVKGVGGWTLDATFNPAPRQFGATLHRARYVDVDAAGNVYFSMNAYVCVVDRTGAPLEFGVPVALTGPTRGCFGGDGNAATPGYDGELEIAMGIDVTNDGSSVYVVEQRYNHVQRWDKNAAGAWGRSAWVLGVPALGDNGCGNDRFASPYDISLDGAGSAYVMDTTCARIQQFDAFSRAYRNTIWSNPPLLYHGLAATYSGTIVVQQLGKRFSPIVAPTACAPDSDIPTVTSVGAPGTTYTQVVSLNVVAADRCSGIATMRITGDVAPGDWVAFNPNAKVTLNAPDGLKTITVEVRDPFGRFATLSQTVRLDTSQPPLQIRSRVRIAGRASLCKPNPLRFIVGGKAKYRVLDRCATFRGRVTRVEKRGTMLLVRVRLSAKTTRAIYRNARTPQQIWVIGQKSRPGARKVRTGSSIVVTAAVVVRKGTRDVTAMPVWRWS
jgi:hypothetical protein